MTTRSTLAQLGLATGKKARLYRIHQHGLRNGTALFLPYDQGLEHGPRDFFANPIAGDPRYIVKLAIEGVQRYRAADRQNRQEAKTGISADLAA